jgi:fluoride exporter
MPLWLYIGAGGFIGAILRYWVSAWIQMGIITFPFGTLGVNTIGSFFLGFILHLSEFKGIFSEQARVFLAIGVLGSFTTMSTFSYESLKLLEQNQILLFIANVLATLFFTLFAVYIGKILGAMW